MARHKFQNIKDMARYLDVIHVRDELNLTDRQRTIFNDIYLHGKSLAQIADEIHVSFSTVAHESVTIRKKLAQLPPVVFAPEEGE